MYLIKVTLQYYIYIYTPCYGTIQRCYKSAGEMGQSGGQSVNVVELLALNLSHDG